MSLRMHQAALNADRTVVGTRKQRLHWWRLVVPAIVLLLGIISHTYAALVPNLPAITTSDMRHARVIVGPETALRQGDQLLLVNGRDPDAWANEGLRGLFELQPHYTVTVARNGQPMTFDVLAQRLPIDQMFVRWFGPALLALAALFVAAQIGLLGGGGAAERGIRLTFIGMACDMCALPLLTAPPLNWIIQPFSLPVQIVAIGVTSGSIVFFMGYPRPSRFWHPRWLPIAVYGVSIGVGMVALWLAPGGPIDRSVVVTERVVTAMATAIALLAMLLSVRAYTRTRDPAARAQLRWIAWGTLLGLPPWIILYALPTLLVNRSPVLYAMTLLPMLLVPFSFALAILRYRLLDVDVVLNRSLVYLALTLGLGAVYIGLTTLLGRALPMLLGAQIGSMTAFLSTLAVATLFAPARSAAQRLVDRVFYRDRTTLLHNVRQAARELRGVEGWGELLPLLSDHIPQTLGIEASLLLLWDGASFVAYGSPKGPLIVTLPPGWSLERPLVLQNWGAEENRRWAEPLIERGYKLAFVLVAAGRPVGMYALGPHRSGGWYDRQTVDSLAELADRIAGAVENARLLEQTLAQAGLRQELAIARRIQQSLLPGSQLQLGALDVAAVNLSASDVGGDLYALHPLDNDGLALAVGDVSGKGVPAALLMAVTSAMLTTVTAENHGPDAVLLRINRQLRGYTAQNRQNVALCYLRFQPLAHKADQNHDAGCAYLMEAANAGAVAPLLRYCSGVTEWLDIGGLPLGVPLDNQQYPVGVRTLHSGDMLLLCTDGLLEAEDSAGNLLSFDGVANLLAAVPNTADAQTTADYLLTRLTAFTDGRDLRDDVTMVVVRIA